MAATYAHMKVTQAKWWGRIKNHLGQSKEESSRSKEWSDTSTKLYITLYFNKNKITHLT